MERDDKYNDFEIENFSLWPEVRENMKLCSD